MAEKNQYHGEKRSAKDAVFLNIPYDQQFSPLFLAYVVGIRAYGLIPRATLEIPGGARRLDRIASLIRSCIIRFMIFLASKSIQLLHQLLDLTCHSNWDSRLHFTGVRARNTLGSYSKLRNEI